MATAPDVKKRQQQAARRVGRILRDFREEAGLRQVDVANRLGRPQQYVSGYESGGHRLDLWELDQVANATGVTLEEILRRYQGRR